MRCWVEARVVFLAFVRPGVAGSGRPAAFPIEPSATASMSVIAFYEKVIKVKADVAAFLY
jgi:hypothetical protein